VLPDLLKTRALYKDDNSIDCSSLETLLKSEKVCKDILDDIKTKLKESSLNSFEKPQRVLLSSREMTIENDCLTPTLKVRRNFASRFYAQDIDSLYDLSLKRIDIGF